MKGMRGCLNGLIVAVLGIGMLALFNDAPVEKPDAAVHPAVFIGILVGGIYFVASILSGKANLTWMLIACAIGAALIMLNGTDAMPTVDNPCPGDEVIIAIGGNCYGMDADANRQWADEMLGGGQP
jgi:hypothetical protein